ncbi:MAG: BlaI/MecI/CopY family transcriptional regulator [Opitutaceae bacterium]|jgi:BlaI family penicillinase repressor|nr:BlaI/MecI/CopY family transcriptional regulator [Opitutaceae bacterium]
MKTPPRISESEWDVMKIIWRDGPCQAQVVIDALSGPNEWSPSTVKTLLNRLLRKGALTHAKTGKSYVYAAAFSETQCRADAAESFVGRVFDGALSPLLAHFAGSRKKLRKEDIAELENLLRASKKKSPAGRHTNP